MHYFSAPLTKIAYIADSLLTEISTKILDLVPEASAIWPFDQLKKEIILQMTISEWYKMLQQLTNTENLRKLDLFLQFTLRYIFIQRLTTRYSTNLSFYRR